MLTMKWRTVHNHRIQAPAGARAVLDRHVGRTPAAPDAERWTDRKQQRGKSLNLELSSRWEPRVTVLSTAYRSRARNSARPWPRSHPAVLRAQLVVGRIE